MLYLFSKYLDGIIVKIARFLDLNVNKGNSGGFRGGSRGSLEPPSRPELFYLHGEFQEILREIRQTNPPFLSLNPLFRNPASAPGEAIATEAFYKIKTTEI